MLRALIAVGVALLVLPATVLAQSKGKGIRLWNLTSATISSFELSPARSEEHTSELQSH